MTATEGGWVHEAVQSPDDGRPRTLGRRVFVSYSTKDGASAADSLVRAIEAEGIACWIAPRDLDPGTGWAQFIERALCDAAGLVVIVSPGSNASDWCYREVDTAIKGGIPLWWTGLAQATPAERLSFYLSVIHGDPIEQLDVRSLVRALEARGRGPLQRLGLPPGGVDLAAAVLVRSEAEAARRDGQYDLARRRFDDLLMGTEHAQTGSGIWTMCMVGQAFAALQSGEVDRAVATMNDLEGSVLPPSSSAAERAMHAARVVLLRRARAA